MGSEWPTVIVVDNSPAIKKLFERSVKGLGVNLEVYNTAADALECLEKIRPDLIFLSIILPDISGITLLKELRKLPLHHDTSVIMVSSKDYAQDRRAADELGVLQYIAKPMPTQILTETILKYTEAKPVNN